MRAMMNQWRQLGVYRRHRDANVAGQHALLPLRRGRRGQLLLSACAGFYLSSFLRPLTRALRFLISWSACHCVSWSGRASNGVEEDDRGAPGEHLANTLHIASRVYPPA